MKCISGKNAEFTGSRSLKKARRNELSDCRKPMVVWESRSPPIFISHPAYAPGAPVLLDKAQDADKVEVQEALPPAGVLGVKPLSLMLRRFSRQTAKRRSRALVANQRVFDSLSLAA